MKLIRDFTQHDTSTLFRSLRTFSRPLVGLPVIFALIPMLGLVAMRPRQLWWLIPVYFSGIVVVTCMLATAYGRLVNELKKRMED